MSDEPEAVIYLRVPLSMHAKVSQIARAQGLSVTRCMKLMITAELEAWRRAAEGSGVTIAWGDNQTKAGSHE